ncbi:MAG: ribonuclease III [Eubacteriales bacterium]|nr:ribonuclease III [Eubacteriales bacterium]
MDRQDLTDAQKKLMGSLNYSFRSPGLFLLALTHRSYAYENNLRAHNERLEFLGDAILEFVVSQRLYRDRMTFEEGQMTKLRALLVCEESLAQISETLSLGAALRLGKGEDSAGGRQRKSILSDALEAILAAIYLDVAGIDPDHFDSNEAIDTAMPLTHTRGLSVISGVLSPFLEDLLKQALNGELVYDYKTALLELLQRKHRIEQIQFKMLDRRGPDHAPVFEMGIFLDDKLLAKALGCGKKSAEQAAAKIALEEIRAQSNRVE